MLLTKPTTQLGFLPSYVIDLDETGDSHGTKGICGVAGAMTKPLYY